MAHSLDEPPPPALAAFSRQKQTGCDALTMRSTIASISASNLSTAKNRAFT